MAEKNTQQSDQNTAAARPRGGGGGHRGGRMIITKPKDFKGTFKRLLKFMRPYWVQIAIVIISTTLTTVISSFAPRVMGYATNEIARGSLSTIAGGGDGIDFALLAQILAVLLGIYIITSVLRYAQNYIMAGISQRTMFDLRESVDQKLRTLPLGYYDSHAYGDVLSRVTNDVDTVSDSLQQSITQMFQSILSIVTILSMMLWISPVLTLVGIITVPLSLYFSMNVVKRSQKFFRGQQSAVGKLNGYIEEMYSGHSVVKAYGRENDTIETFEQINANLRSYAKNAQFISGIIMPVVGFFSNLGYVLVTVVGAGFILNGQLLIGDIQAFVRYLKQLSDPINETASIVNVLQSTVAAAERIFEVLDEQEEVPEKNPPEVIEKPQGSVVIEDVRFSYSPDSELIRKLNVSVSSGERVAIVGPTGAGKTTIVNLLMRFYDVDAGRILVDGVDIREMSRSDLRSMFGMVLQDTWLFRGTVRENIRYGRLDATDDEVVQAAKMAYAHNFIMQLPGGYDFELGEDASNISQGQRQLLTIARAILSDPAILILDEATSSVDTRTEVLIQKAMNNLMHGRTSFVIAHRLSTIRDSDTILVLSDGDIIEQGAHDELIAKGGFYANLYNSQFRYANRA